MNISLFPLKIACFALDTHACGIPHGSLSTFPIFAFFFLFVYLCSSDLVSFHADRDLVQVPMACLLCLFFLFFCECLALYGENIIM